jgi:hypothetical protein
MHHLILIRQNDPEFSGSIGCCCRIEASDVRWDLSGHRFPETWEKKTGFGSLYRELRQRFGNQLELTVLDPRNFISFIPLVIRDAVRFGVPIGETIRAVTATSNSTGVLDGRVVYQGGCPSIDEVIAMVEERLEGEAQPA